jgi:selenocysteine-specific elongation factor
LKNVVIGTAGHIDHGKTALVKALTGIDADRLAEEKRRGITIDIGFAHLELPPDLRLAFVDVPGHERFVKNMLAGAGGIDVVLLVIAAGESVKPQTREHFDICRLLGIRTGIIALTKSDLVDDDLLELTRLEIQEFVAGSFLENAPIIPVSATTRRGLDELRAALRCAAEQITAKDAAGAFRLPIDRAFTMKGFGAVVTGTLVSGEIRPEQEVMLYPAGRVLRVRGVQVHGAPAACAIAGQRTAVNLSGIEAHEIARGMSLADPFRFRPVRKLDCALESLPSAPAIKNRMPVHFHAGTAEIEAEIRLFRGESAIAPGARTYARIVLRDPALLLPRDRFIIRRFSPVTTIGGGVVLDITPPRKTAYPRERLAGIEKASAAEWIELLVRESVAGLSRDELTTRTGLLPGQIEPAVRASKSILVFPGWLADRTRIDTIRTALIHQIQAFHQAHPLLPGIPKQALRGGLPLALLDAILNHPQIAVEGDIVRHRSHRVVLQQEETEARVRIESAFEKAGLAVPSVDEALAASGVEPARARTLLQILVREKRLLRINDELVFHHSAIDRLRQQLLPLKGRQLTVPEFKELAGISRKYAIPLLEFLDHERITRREGDKRLVL